MEHHSHDGMLDGPSHDEHGTEGMGMMIMSGDGENDESSFCHSGKMPMTMYMDGFHWSHWAAGGNNNTLHPCLLYLVPTWLLDSEGRFQGAVVYSFLLGLLLEITSAVRVAVTHFFQTRQPHYYKRTQQHAVLTVLYAVQSMLGFVLMLTAMTFSVEILGGTLCGLAAGNLLLFRYRDFAKPTKRLLSPQQQQQDDEGAALLPSPSPHRAAAATNTNTATNNANTTGSLIRRVPAAEDAATASSCCSNSANSNNNHSPKDR